MPHKKQYIEFITALLSIPVLLTVIILNFNSLKTKDEAQKQESETKPIVVTVPVEKSTPAQSDEKPTSAPTNAACKKEIGPVSISSPVEGETITDSPVIVSVAYDDETYCVIVWSYRINNGRWSDFDDKAIALYDPPEGQVTLDVRVKSIATGAEKRLSRAFTYQPSVTPSPTTAATPTQAP